ncbi:NAD-binding protein [Mesorhizobium sp. M0296]|uniref:NAD-binding protein n=1 Tax=Mesorhizobium sp. M0296 TaxID=2956931 RepID=UPI00333DA11B
MRSEMLLSTLEAVSFHVGDIGPGQSVKLPTSPLFYAPAVASCDALCRSVRGGVPAQQAWRTFVGSSANSVAVGPFAPFLLDGSYDRSGTLEIAVKDMGLTIQQADELGVGLPIGRAGEKRYSQPGRKFDRYDNHLGVVELARVAFRVRLHVPGYRAPSKCGADPAHPPDQEFLTDAVGRTKPKREHVFPLHDVPQANAQIRLIECLARELTHVNRLILAEALDLRRGMGLSNALIYDVITWSVEAFAWSGSHTGQYDNEKIVDPSAAVAPLKNIPHLIYPLKGELS